MNELINDLKNYHLHLNPKEGVLVTDLFDDAKCKHMLEEQSNIWGAPNLVIAASMFIKRYAMITVSSTMYSMIVHQTVLSLHPATLTWSKNGSLGLKHEEVVYITLNKTNRNTIRESYLQQLFAQHLTPLVLTLSRMTGVKEEMLWENIAVRINSVYRKLLEKNPSEQVITNIYEDFHFLIQADAELFGIGSNPLACYLKIGEELKENPQRKTCCLYYLLDKNRGKGNYCVNCPLI
ncbi:(2Fe-2S)-binding protein [Gracilibacillus caseinilyticus]|uniref:(2Fe-2S)-binding protein n=1 Tax=Gracilibacillus caseinilyticus TaxID=2932256 RepID=A0ABY4F150_9BACI|nr:IucA/IucC family C-terminal-domain containing protein [Gracilibacillus caseinilyticus]UOQ50408.1 (2Fe-2S)-binding protein [Gracilibacillus caseinilyticus]